MGIDLENTMGSRARATRTIGFLLAAIGVATVAAYGGYPWLCRRGVGELEASASLPGDGVVPNPTTGYTLALWVAAPPSRVWPWLVQMGQGRAGFYTHESVEKLMGAGIDNADRIMPDLQRLAIGDRIRLTPDPYLGRPGQYITVAELAPSQHLVFHQLLPSGGVGSWAYVLRPVGTDSTRLIFRRRGSQPSLFDRIMEPGYYFMDVGMLGGIKRRAEMR